MTKMTTTLITVRLRVWYLQLHLGQNESEIEKKYSWNNLASQWARKLKKIPGQKKTVKSNKSISRIFWGAKNHFLNWEKVSNCQKCNFTKIFFWFIWIHDFFGLDFFKFSGPVCTYLLETRSNSSESKRLNGNYIRLVTPWNLCKLFGDLR